MLSKVFVGKTLKLHVQAQLTTAMIFHILNKFKSV